jgi:hypothetical protein
MPSLRQILECSSLASMSLLNNVKVTKSKRRLLTEYDKQDGVGATLESLTCLVQDTGVSSLLFLRNRTLTRECSISVLRCQECVYNNIKAFSFCCNLGVPCYVRGCRYVYRQQSKSTGSSCQTYSPERPDGLRAGDRAVYGSMCVCNCSLRLELFVLFANIALPVEVALETDATFLRQCFGCCNSLLKTL